MLSRSQPEELGPEVDQPGLGELREAAANAADFPRGADLRQDGIAGLTVAISGVPDGMAGGVLVGVNPLYGLYGNMIGALVGGALSSSQLMVVSNTSAVALVAGQALLGLPEQGRDNALFLMVMLAGAFAIVAGLLRLDRLTRFVSYSVMTGFLTGVAVLTVLSQFSTVTGYEASGGSTLARAVDVLANLGQANLFTVAMALLTLVLAVALPRTALGAYGTLIAIVAPSLLVAFFQWEGVELVRDVGDIPGGVPAPFIPSLSDFSPEIVTAALSLAVIMLVQGAGVSQSVPNPDGSRSEISRDFISQGAANVVAGLFRGLPVGGSLSATALNVVSGARSRWAAILAGVWMAVIVIGFPQLVSLVAMPALGALLILAGLSSIKPAELGLVWDIGWSSQLAAVATFLATLFLPMQVAVGIGVLLSAVLYLSHSSTDISVVELVRREDGRIVENKRPQALRSNALTVLDVYGHLYYAGARTLERLLPPVKGAEKPAVVLRLRGHGSIGATLVDVLADYADALERANGRLYLTGIHEEAFDELERADRLRRRETVRAFQATPVIGQSTDEAVAEAQAWLATVNGEEGAGSSAHKVSNSRRQSE